MPLADLMNTPVKADKSAILERDRKSVHQLFELVEAMAGRASTATHDEMENGINLEGGVLKADARGLCFRLTGPLGEADSHDVVGAALEGGNDVNPFLHLLLLASQFQPAPLSPVP